MKRWILLFLSCVLLGCFFAYCHDPDVLSPFKGSFLTIIFAVTTFSVMFSMGSFNSSPYRHFHHAFPARLLWACVILLFVALAPLTTLVFWPPRFVSVCLLLLPTLVMAGAGLLEIARRETDPLTLLDRLCSLKEFERYLHSLVPLIDAKIDTTKKLGLTERGNRPTHEIDWHITLPPQKDDPISNLATLGLLAIKHADLHAFSRVIRRSLEAIHMAENFNPAKSNAGDYKMREELRDQVFAGVERITTALQQDKGAMSLCRVAIDVFAELTVKQTKNCQQTQKLTFTVLALMEDLSKHCYENGFATEIRVPIIVARQIVQKGMDNPPEIPSDEKRRVEMYEFHHRLPQLTTCIKRIGSYAIAKGDSELLYRCFDAFAWLGCSAVRKQEGGVVSVCLQALSQLAREVRVKELECFWSQCPVRPEDHAIERIDWVTQAAAELESDVREHFVGLLNCSYSRYYGREVTIQFETDASNKKTIKKVFSEEKHVESYVMHAGARDVDYSDFAFLKDFELRSGKGILMEGPLVPISL